MDMKTMQKQGLMDVQDFKDLLWRVRNEGVDYVSGWKRVKQQSHYYNNYKLEDGSVLRVVKSYSTVIGVCLLYNENSRMTYARINYNHSPTTSKHHNYWENVAHDIELLNNDMLQDLIETIVL